MKALFIIHCQDPIYGASRSLGNLIRNLDADVDIIFPVKIKNEGRITPEQIQQFYGPRVRHIWYLPQPAKLFVQGDVSFQLQQAVKSAVKDVLYFLAQPVYRHLYKSGNYDFIHLNSITLYPMLQKEWPMFLHIREPIRADWKKSDARLQAQLNKAAGVIAIGEENRKRCPPLNVPVLTLINPYDQTPVGDVDVTAARKRFGLTGQETVYAIIGNIFPEKGVDFVIGAFRKARLENAVLLVAGEDTNHNGYEQIAREKAGDDPRIRFLGGVPDNEALYRVVDFVIRGDNVTGAGRTVFESLYSGGGAILMGTREENLPSMELPPELQKNVYFYPVRDEKALTAVLEETQSIRFADRVYRSTIEEYKKQFLAFIRQALERRAH